MSVYIINTEPEETAVPVDADEMLIHDASAVATKKLGLDTLKSYMGTGLVSATAATLAITELAHAGRIIVLNKIDGITVTLPAATGTGARYRFVVGTTVTSVGYIIKVADASDLMDGIIYAADDTGTPAPLVWVAGSTDDTITLDGSTKGGIIGDEIELIDIASNQWMVRGFVKQSGSEATPFSATVS